MSRPIIEVENLSKCYRLGVIGATSLRETFNRLLHNLKQGPARQDAQEFWALRDVSFSVQRGEVVGIIGRNGAGKSTLLKILSRITEPTSGRARLRGRTASLLEVGTGFHPELTGRENVFLNGAILGMSRAEVRKKFDEIVAFAEVDQFIDTPVKRYSSGMYVRLAFAVAAHLEPEILIVDEVLAVGDSQFQNKCLGKMHDVSSQQGRTVLFVSHNMAALRAICDRSVLLREGRVERDGPVDEVIGHYLAGINLSPSKLVWPAEARPHTSEIAFELAAVLDPAGESPPDFDHRRSFRLVLDFEVFSPTRDLIIGFDLQNTDGVLVCGSNNMDNAVGKTWQPGHYRAECAFPGYLFNEGRYRVRFVAHTLDRELLGTDFCLSFDVKDVLGHGPSFMKVHGILRPDLQWQTGPLALSAS